MKAAILLLIGMAGTMVAQVSPGQQVVYVSTDPTGGCGPAYITVNRTTGVISECVGGVWQSFQQAVTPGGSSGDIQYNNAGALGGAPIANCVAAGGVLQYTSATHTFSCHTLASSDIPDLSATYSTKTAGGDLSGTLPSPTVAKVNGTAVGTNAAADQVPVTTASQTASWTSIANCTDSGGNHLNYSTSTHTFSCGTSAGSVLWSGLGNPGANLSLTMAAWTTTFTHNAATGASNLHTWTDTTNNSGTGILGKFTTASGSAATPWQADANGVGYQVSSAGAFTGVGQSGGSIITWTGTAFASLGSPANGTMKYCSDCTVTSGVDNTCADSGTGALAVRLNGAWKCFQ